MTIQLSTAARNDVLAAIIARLGANPILRIRTGAAPANPAAARSGTVLSEMALGASPFGTPSGGAVAKAGTWQDSSADASGDSGHYELLESTGTTCHWQGICTAPWQASRNYTLGAHVTNDSGKVYRCTTPGVAASSGGPTGTGATIADGAAVWTYVGASVAALGALALVAPVSAGVTVTVDTFTLTAPNA